MSLDVRHSKFGLPSGNWRFDPTRRTQIWVPDDREAVIDDAFDEEPPRPRLVARDIEHGTEYGYKLHLERGVEVCQPCRKAMTTAARERRARRRLNRAKDAA